MQNTNTLSSDSSDTFNRLARFGANITDAFGCYIFLPSSLLPLENLSGSNAPTDTLILAGKHTLSNDIVRNCSIEVGHGLIGWVSKHKRSIHVSPFERDSRTLGLYHSDQSLKSFIGIPVSIDNDDFDFSGVIACDSKKSFAFSKLQGKLLEDLSNEISSQLRLNYKLLQNGKQKNSWQEFLNRSIRLSEDIGRDSIEVLRVKLENNSELEKLLGSGRALALCEQLHRLIEQSLPANFPFIRFPNGDIVIISDNMMTSFVENKIVALAEHCAVKIPSLHDASKITSRKIGIRFSFSKQSANARKNKGLSLEELIQITSESAQPVDTQGSEMQAGKLQAGFKRDMGLIYEYKRA